PLMGGLIGAQERAGRRARQGRAAHSDEVNAAGERYVIDPGATGGDTMAWVPQTQSQYQEYPPLEEGERPQMSLFDEGSPLPSVPAPERTHEPDSESKPALNPNP